MSNKNQNEKNEKESLLKKNKDPPFTKGLKYGKFGFGAMTDQMSHQAFQVLTFTFYYAVIGISVDKIAIAFILFAIWDSINDPIVGSLSDRTKSKIGRRRVWILFSFIPFGLINYLLFVVPNSSENVQFAYMIIIIMMYDLFYTMFSSNQTALFAEMFKTELDRSRANLFKNIMTILGVILGSVLPTVIISPMAPTEEVSAEEVAAMYRTTGIMLFLLVLILGYLFYRIGIQEDPQEIIKPQEMPSIKESLKMTIKNKTFIIFVTANLFVWFVFKMLTSIIPLYGQFVLEIPAKSLILTLMLLLAFLSATVFFPVMRKIGLKYGMRNGFIISGIVWIVALIPFGFFDGTSDIPMAMFFMIIIGFGLSGAMYYVDIIIGSIIDEDELKTGKRRNGSYYGVNALINRYSTILVFVAIMIVLQRYGWTYFLVGAGEGAIINFKTGLKILITFFTISALIIVIILLKIFPLHGKKLKEIQEQVQELRKKQNELL